MNISELANFRGGVSVDTISELTSASGVTIDSMLIKDGKTSSNNIDWQEPTMFRNRIINGGFDIWQRGTSQTTSDYGSSDRWKHLHTGSTKTASRQTFTLGQTDVPGNPKYYQRTVVSSVAGSGNYVLMAQFIESVYTFAGQQATLSFYAKADAAKNIAIEFGQSFGSGGSPSASIDGISVTTIALTAAWTKYTVTLTLPSISGKTLGSGNDFLRVYFWFEAGSTLDSRTNSLGQQSGTFDIAQVQLEPGSIATPFEFRPYGTELALCQRYYEVIPLNQIPALYKTAGTAFRHLGRIAFKATKRTTPSTIDIIGGSAYWADGVWIYSETSSTGFNFRGITTDAFGVEQSRQAGGATPTDNLWVYMEGYITVAATAEL